MYNFLEVFQMYNITKDTLENLATATSTSDVVTVEGLKPNTYHYFYARPTEGSDCQEWVFVYGGFPAEYTEVELPFIDGFEDNQYQLTYSSRPLNWYGYYQEFVTEYHRAVVRCERAIYSR